MNMKQHSYKSTPSALHRLLGTALLLLTFCLLPVILQGQENTQTQDTEPFLPQVVTLRAEMDSFQIFIGEQTRVWVRVTAPTDAQVRFQAFQDTLMTGVEVIHANLRADSITMDDAALKELTAVYTITSFDSALYALPPFQVEVNGARHSSNSLVLKVMNVPVDISNPDQFFPLRDVLSPAFTWRDAYFLLLFATLAALLIIALIACFRNFPAAAPTKIMQLTPPQSLYEQALHLLHTLPKYVTTDKEYYTALTTQLRNCITDYYGFDAHTLTGDELQAKDAVAFVPLRTLFRAAEMAMFAKALIPTTDKQAHLKTACAFIEALSQAIETEVTKASQATQQAVSTETLQTSTTITQNPIAAAETSPIPVCKVFGYPLTRTVMLSIGGACLIMLLIIVCLWSWKLWIILYPVISEYLANPSVSL